MRPLCSGRTAITGGGAVGLDRESDSVPQDPHADNGRMTPPPGRPFVDQLEDMEYALIQKERVIQTLQEQLEQGIKTSEALEHVLEEQVARRDKTIADMEKNQLLLNSVILEGLSRMQEILPMNKRKHLPAATASSKEIAEVYTQVVHLVSTEYIM